MVPSISDESGMSDDIMTSMSVCEEKRDATIEELRNAARTLLDGGQVDISQKCLKRVLDDLERPRVASLQSSGGMSVHNQPSFGVVQEYEPVDSFDTALSSSYIRPKSYHFTPLGCFHVVEGESSMLVYKEQMIRDRRPESCGRMCETTIPGERGYQLFAIVDGSQCYCGHQHPSAELRRDDAECAPCDADSRHSCGGTQVQSVYKACDMPLSAWVSEGEYVSGLQTTGDLAFERGYCKEFAREGGWGMEHPGNPRSSHIWQKCEPRTIDPPYQVCTKMSTLWVDLFDRNIGLTFGHNHLWILCKLYKVVFCRKCSLSPKPKGCDHRESSLKSCTTKKRAVCQWNCEMYSKERIPMPESALSTCETNGGVVQKLMEGRQGCCFRGCSTPQSWHGVPEGHQWCTPHLQTL